MKIYGEKMKYRYGEIYEDIGRDSEIPIKRDKGRYGEG